MPKFCSDECKEYGQICHFCIHYEDNCGRTPRVCDGFGICLSSGELTDIIGGCDDFVCFNVDPINDRKTLEDDIIG